MKKTSFKPFFLELITAIALVFVLIGFLMHYMGENERLSNQLTSGQLQWQSDMARLKVERNKLGQEVATIVALNQTTRQELAATQAAHGSTMELLQKEVKKNSQLTAIIRNQTGGTVVIKTDTILVVDSTSTLPVYQGEVKDVWADISVIASPDTIIVDYLVRNEFVFETVKSGGGLFRDPEIRASVKSLNPNTETVGLSTWVVPKKKPKRLAWLGVGAAVGFSGAVYLFSR